MKMLASAITIGSGGSAGREGPTALIAAGFGSVYAKFLHRPEQERRLIVLMGMAAGLSAIFRSPIGTAIFAVEVLYGAWNSRPRPSFIACWPPSLPMRSMDGLSGGNLLPGSTRFSRRRDW